MYAIIEIGGKQYRVTKGSEIDVEKLNLNSGKSIILDKILLLSEDNNVKIGQPYLKKVKITGLVIKQFKAPKKISYKYRRRKSSHWKKGHRQVLTRIKIKDIITTD